jgi:metallo-beta-lactamase class B
MRGVFLGPVLRVAAATTVLLGAVSCSLGPPAPLDSVEGHIAEAERLAGDDLKALLVLCKPAPAKRPPQGAIDRFLAEQIARPAPEPGRAFDNLYFVGAAWVSAWALTTSKGIILIDALNNRAEAEKLIDGGMRKLGLNPVQLRYLLITHAHGDHYGGAEYLVPRYRAAVAMSDADWRQVGGTLEFNSPVWGLAPSFDRALDLRLRDGDRLTLGDTAVDIHVTAGHTHGTITPVFEVREGGRTHKVLLWGGTAFNFGKDVARLERYIESTERMAKIARAQGIDVMISNHSGYDGSLAKLEALRRGASPNPFVIGTDAVVRGLQAMGACAKAQRDRYLLQ